MKLHPPGMQVGDSDSAFRLGDVSSMSIRCLFEGVGSMLDSGDGGLFSPGKVLRANAGGVAEDWV
jgi:hypothetical protein